MPRYCQALNDQRVLMSDIIIYTDGSCNPNPGTGGWAAIIDGAEHSGRVESTTNNRMELLAVINALQIIGKNNTVVIHCDSSYVVNGIGNWLEKKPLGKPGWMVGWSKNNWVKHDNKKVLNADLWKALSKMVLEQDRIIFKLVKGHSGIPLNERCDQLAQQARNGK